MSKRIDPSTKHILILGGGFGGLEAAKRLRHPKLRVTLIDRQNHHLFQPLLYQVATASLSAIDIAQPLRGILSDRENLLVVMDEVVSIDAEKKTVRALERDYTYDYLIFAIGARTSYFGKDDWEKFAPGLKTLDDALRIRRDVLYSLERAETETRPEERARLMTFVIVGGGPTGVEMAGALAELTHRILRKNFRNIDPSEARIILIDGNPYPLAMYPEELGKYAKKSLEKLGVEFITDVHVTGVGADYVLIGEQKIYSLNIIWAAGVQGNPPAKTLPGEHDRGNRVKVGLDLAIPGHSDIFVIGDAAIVTDANKVVVPGLAPAATQMGRFVADLITAEVKGMHPTDRPKFRYLDKGSMATIGRISAVAQVGNWKFKGIIAWLAWLFIHILFLVGLRNKIAVFISWCWAYVASRSNARVVTGLSTRLRRRAVAQALPGEGGKD